MLISLMILSILAGISIIASNSTIYSTLFLCLTFILVSVFLTIVNINYVGLLYIVIYVGAILILILFVLQLVNSDSKKRRRLTLTFYGLMVLYLIGYTTCLYFLIDVPVPDITLFDDVQELTDYQRGVSNLDVDNEDMLIRLSDRLYNTGALLIIMISFVLLLSMVGPIILCN